MAFELLDLFSFIAFLCYIHQTAIKINPSVLVNRLGLSQEDWQLNFCIPLDQSYSLTQFMSFE